MRKFFVIFFSKPLVLLKNYFLALIVIASEQTQSKGVQTISIHTTNISAILESCTKAKFPKKQAHWWRKLFLPNLVSFKFTENIFLRLENQNKRSESWGVVGFGCVRLWDILQILALRRFVEQHFHFRQLSDDPRRYQMCVSCHEKVKNWNKKVLKWISKVMINWTTAQNFMNWEQNWINLD